MVFINGLKEWHYINMRSLALQDTTYDYLSEEDRAIATNKG